MAVIQISRVQVRRGLRQDLPQLASGELGWAVDERKLFIGNGTISEGAPLTGNTEILTQYSDVLSLFDTYTFKGVEGGFEVLTGQSFLDKVFRPMQSKLDDFVNVRDFGAIGRGNVDDTAAVVRALKQLYNSTNYAQFPEQHRTIYFPAGRYRISGAVLKILPWTRIVGDGKASTEIIQVDDTQAACVRFVDNFEQQGLAYGDAQGGVAPLTNDYLIENIAIIHSAAKPALLINGGNGAIFNRVRFSCSAANIASVTSTPDYSTVNLNGSSINGGIKNVMFHQCDFAQAAHGVEINNLTTKVSFVGCSFDKLYYGILAGNNSPSAYKPNSITVSTCGFDNIKAEAIRTEAGVKSVVSMSNTYHTNVGRDGNASATPTHPVIYFNDDSNFSIADRFGRSPSEELLYKPVNTNGKNCYLLLPNAGTVSGLLHTDSGRGLTLSATATLTDTVIRVYNDVFVDYTVTAVLADSSEPVTVRTGTMRVSAGQFDSVNFEEDYTESYFTGLEFSWKVDTGSLILQYKLVSSSVNQVQFLHNIRYFR